MRTHAEQPTPKELYYQNAKRFNTNPLVIYKRKILHKQLNNLTIEFRNKTDIFREELKHIVRNPQVLKVCKIVEDYYDSHFPLNPKSKEKQTSKPGSHNWNIIRDANSMSDFLENFEKSFNASISEDDAHFGIYPKELESKILQLEIRNVRQINSHDVTNHWLNHFIIVLLIWKDWRRWKMLSEYFLLNTFTTDNGEVEQIMNEIQQILNPSNENFDFLIYDETLKYNEKIKKFNYDPRLQQFKVFPYFSIVEQLRIRLKRIKLPADDKMRIAPQTLSALPDFKFLGTSIYHKTAEAPILKSLPTQNRVSVKNLPRSYGDLLQELATELSSTCETFPEESKEILQEEIAKIL